MNGVVSGVLNLGVEPEMNVFYQTPPTENVDKLDKSHPLYSEILFGVTHPRLKI